MHTERTFQGGDNSHLLQQPVESTGTSPIDWISSLHSSGDAALRRKRIRFGSIPESPSWSKTTQLKDTHSKPDSPSMTNKPRQVNPAKRPVTGG